MVLELVFFLLMLIWNLLLCVRYKAWQTDYIIQMLLNTLLNFFLIPFFGGLFGFFVSRFAKRLNAYLLLVFFALLGSPLANGLGYILSEVGVNIYPFLNMFDLFPPNLSWRPVSAFGHSILPYRWEIVGFWIFLTIGILFYKISQKNLRTRLVGLVTAGLISLLGLTLFLQPASKLLLSSDDPKESIMTDWDYYIVKHPDDKESTATFAIKEYDLEFTVGRELKASAVLKIDKNDLNEYPFTLYHGYHIQSVKNDKNQALSYVRDGDAVTVYNPGEQLINEICITYHGYSGICYSNLQGIFLPGYFPYYPHSGHQQVYNREQYSYERLVLEEAALFQVKVKSTQDVYCNLTSNGNNTFKGQSTGLTLLSGLYDSLTVDGITVVYPYLNTSEFTPKTITEFIHTHAGTSALGASVETVLITPKINDTSPYTRYAPFSDHLLIQQILGFDITYKDQLADSKKQELDRAYRLYLENPSGVREHVRGYLESRNDAFPDMDPKDFGEPNATEYLINYIDFYGEEKGLANISEYLNDKTNRTHWKEFIKNRD